MLDNTWLSRLSDSSSGDTLADSARLDTTWTRSFVDSTSVLRVGDSITGNLPWSRATRFGGIQLQRDFALQPDLITFPIPQFLGQAAVPSTVDLYVNGLRRYSGETPAGPFQLGTVPIVNGAGNAQVVVTDALGRQTTFDFPFYTTSQLLRPGLDDYSLELGFVRENYGVSSFDYASDPTVSARLPPRHERLVHRRSARRSDLGPRRRRRRRRRQDRRQRRADRLVRAEQRARQRRPPGRARLQLAQHLVQLRASTGCRASATTATSHRSTARRRPSAPIAR